MKEQKKQPMHPLHSSLPSEEQEVLEFFQYLYVPFEEWDEWDIGVHCVISYKIENGHVTTLYLRECSSKNHMNLPDSLKNLKYLQELGIYNCIVNPFQIHGLKYLRTLIFDECLVKPFSEEIGSLENLEKIRFLGTTAENFPFEFFQSKKLIEFNLGHSKIINFDINSLGSFPNLQKLILDSWNIQEIPSFFTNLKLLKDLTLSGLNLPTIPSSLCNLPLDTLILSNTKTHTLPNDWKNLIDLKSFTFSENPLSSKNLYEIRKLNHLKHLTLNGFDIENNFKWVSGVPKLGELSLSNNRIKTLPSELSQLRMLKSIDLSFNKFDQFPQVLLELKNLMRINIRHNKIKNIPKNIDSLSKLKFLDFGSNLLKSVPKSLKNLRNLKELQLFKNKLTRFPEIPPNLVSLNINNNNIEKVLVEKENYTLENLGLISNKITSDSLNIGKFRSLLTLELNHNPLKEFPPSLRSLTRLEELSMYGCQISKIPSWIDGLEMLKELSININMIKKLPESFFKLSNLRFLNLSENSIQEIPGNIDQLKHLTYLHLENNEITELPSRILDLPVLMTIHLEGNPEIQNIEILRNHKSVYLCR